MHNQTKSNEITVDTQPVNKHRKSEKRKRYTFNLTTFNDFSLGNRHPCGQFAIPTVTETSEDPCNLMIGNVVNDDVSRCRANECSGFSQSLNTSTIVFARSFIQSIVSLLAGLRLNKIPRYLCSPSPCQYCIQYLSGTIASITTSADAQHSIETDVSDTLISFYRRGGKAVDFILSQFPVQEPLKQQTYQNKRMQAVRCLLSNLLAYADKLERNGHGGRGICIPTKTKVYSRKLREKVNPKYVHIGHDAMMAAIEWLLQHDLMAVKVRAQYFKIGKISGRARVFAPTPTLLALRNHWNELSNNPEQVYAIQSLINTHETELAHWGRILIKAKKNSVGNEDTDACNLMISDNKVNDVTESMDYAEMRDELTRFNEVNLSHTFEIYLPYGLDVAEPSAPYSQWRTIPPHSLIYSRIFSNNSNLEGGRYYCNLLSGVNKYERQNIRIDDEETVTLDYNGLHLRLGIDYHNLDFAVHSDIYNLPDCALPRWLIKSVVNTSINRSKSDVQGLFKSFFPNRKIQKEGQLATGLRKQNNKYNYIRMMYGEDVGIIEREQDQASGKSAPNSLCLELVEDAYDAVCTHFGDVANRLIGTGFGITAQYIESQITRYVMRTFADANKPIITIHDGNMVRKSDEHFLRATMRAGYLHVMGKEIPDEAIVRETYISDRLGFAATKVVSSI